MKRRAFADLNVTSARPGVERRVFSGDGATLAFTTLDPGHSPFPHSHSYEQIVYMLSGRARFVVGRTALVGGAPATGRRDLRR